MHGKEDEDGELMIDPLNNVGPVESPMFVDEAIGEMIARKPHHFKVEE